MSTVRVGRATTMLLLLCCLLLAGLVTAQLTDRTKDRPNSLPSATVAEPAEAAPELPPAYMRYDPPSRAAFDEILERPLFLQGRRPPEAAPEPAKPAAPRVRPQLQMLGVAVTQDTQVALVLDIKSRQLLRFVQGTQHQGWTVTSVESGQAVLQRGEEVLELHLDQD